MTIEGPSSIKRGWDRVRFQYHLLVASRDLHGVMLRFDHILAAMRLHLAQGIETRPRSLGERIEQAGIKSVLDIGCSHDPEFLHYLERKIPGDVELVGINPYGQAGRSGRVELIIGEAADLESLLAGRKFDLITCNGVFSYRELFSEKYDQKTNARLIVEGAIKTLSDHQRAAAFFNAFSQNWLLYSRNQFAQFGRVTFAAPRLRTSSEVLQTAVLTPKNR